MSPFCPLLLPNFHPSFLPLHTKRKSVVSLAHPRLVSPVPPPPRIETRAGYATKTPSQELKKKAKMREIAEMFVPKAGGGPTRRRPSIPSTRTRKRKEKTKKKIVPPPLLDDTVSKAPSLDGRLSPPTSERRIHHLCTGYSMNKHSHRQRLNVVCEPPPLCMPF